MWTVLPNPGREDQYVYVGITADGRIGWVSSSVEPKVLNQIMVVEMIENPERFGVRSTGWKSYVFNDGDLRVLAKYGRNDEHTLVTMLTESQGASNRRFWVRPAYGALRAAAGDLVMQVFYRPPANADPNQPPIHVQQPSPNYLRRLAQ